MFIWCRANIYHEPTLPGDAPPLRKVMTRHGARPVANGTNDTLGRGGKQAHKNDKPEEQQVKGRVHKLIYIYISYVEMEREDRTRPDIKPNNTPYARPTPIATGGLYISIPAL